MNGPFKDVYMPPLKTADFTREGYDRLGSAVIKQVANEYRDFRDLVRSVCKSWKIPGFCGDGKRIMYKKTLRTDMEWRNFFNGPDFDFWTQGLPVSGPGIWTQLVREENQKDAEVEDVYNRMKKGEVIRFDEVRPWWVATFLTHKRDMLIIDRHTVRLNRNDH